MFEQYSYKTKFSALALVFCMLCVAAYKRSFHTLIEVVGENRQLSDTAADINLKSGNAGTLMAEIANLDKALGKEGATKEIVQQEIISFVTRRHAGVSINEVQPIHVFSDESYTAVTNQLDVTGTADRLLRLAYDFEKNFSLSKITSMDFYTVKKNDKTESLHLKIIFQNYEGNK
ncbi:MAG: hypothetical protein EOO01_00195 [Chitinophagaceae bacterium]|nr:MAG: hypothetical protein EOO01_00195 [Chitinophagaceae bacterium]